MNPIPHVGARHAAPTLIDTIVQAQLQRRVDMMTQRLLEQIDGAALLARREEQIIALLESEGNTHVAFAALIKAYAIATGDGPKAA